MNTQWRPGTARYLVFPRRCGKKWSPARPAWRTLAATAACDHPSDPRIRTVAGCTTRRDAAGPLRSTVSSVDFRSAVSAENVTPGQPCCFATRSQRLGKPPRGLPHLGAVWPIDIGPFGQVAPFRVRGVLRCPLGDRRVTWKGRGCLKTSVRFDPSPQALSHSGERAKGRS